MPWWNYWPTIDLSDDFGWVFVVIGAVGSIVVWVVLHRGP